MKKPFPLWAIDAIVISAIVASSLIVICARAATEFDLRKGIDLTGATNVTASQLNQLVDAGLISSTNKGGILRRSGNGGGYWPDVTLNPRYTNFLWLDLFSSPPVLKTYVPIGDAYTNWVNAGAAAAIPNASIGNAQLAANAVQTTNIATNAVTSGQINPGSILNYHIASGAVSNANIADGTILNAKLAVGSVLSTNIAASQLLPIHFTANSVVSNSIAANAVGNAHLTGQAVNATNIINATITSNQIAASTIGATQIATNVSAGFVKCWGVLTNTGVGATLLKGMNCNAATASRSGVGIIQVSFSGDFAPSVGTYCAVVSTGLGSNNVQLITDTIKSSTVIGFQTTLTNGVFIDNYNLSFIILDFP